MKGKIDLSELYEYADQERRALTDEYYSRITEKPRKIDIWSRGAATGSAYYASRVRTNSEEFSETTELVDKQLNSSNSTLPIGEQCDDRFSYFCSESDETIHASHLCALLDEGESNFEDMFWNEKEKGTWWLDCLNPTDAEMRTLAKTFDIHPLTAEDIHTKDAREKVEMFPHYYFVAFHTFNADKESKDYLDDENVYIVVFRQGLLTFHFADIVHPARVRNRIRQLRDYMTVGADWMCYALVDDIVDYYAPLIHEIELEADGIEDSVFITRHDDHSHMLQRIGETRKKIMTVIRLLSGKADVVKMYAKRCNENFDNASRTEIGLYLGDIHDHIVTMYQNLVSYEKILSRSHANYLAQVQVESFHSNNRVTELFSKVTVIGTILVPLNLITGLFGMNVRVPGEGASGLGWFFGILAFIIFVVFTMYFLVSRCLFRDMERLRPSAIEDTH
ncbi:hypothetical protein CANCADRAFT_23524 [Tortispora caseinolytica NRRL Y-17796]|uniref:Uncharacterized protein n=1 Tax=Tortispora caseinolytica NRRL Y-17796 TaxID=767744 RepID=A0A1E4TIM8_9ASCO|nr:hypothetical protein CANCADRAFT_23524 [Tortispora caseinolytica NRRL Y-17796]